MADLQRAFSVTDGVAAAERTSLDPEAMYASPEELNTLYGCLVTDADIRAAMTLIHTACNRPSLWPTEYELTLRLPSDRQETRLPITPVRQILEAAGRYAPGRRDHQAWNITNQGYAALILLGGGRPAFSPIPVASIDLDPATGMIWLPYTPYMVPYSVVRVKFIAGFLEIPPAVKLAMFDIITTMHARQVSSRSSFSLGRLTQRFEGTSFVSEQAKALLAPFVVRALY